MNSISYAITWELLRRAGWILIAATLGTTLFFGAIIRSIEPNAIANSENPEAVFCQFVLIQVLMFVMGSIVIAVQGSPSRLYAYPIKTSTLVACQLSAAMAIAAIVFLASVAALNFHFGLDFPLWGPAMFLAAAVALVQATAWLAEKSLWLPLAVAAVGAALGLWLQSRYGAPMSGSMQSWSSLSPGEFATFLAATGAAFGAANWAVARNRRGDEPLSLGVIAWISRAFDRTASARAPFSSTAQAQHWFERRRKSFIMPSIVVGYVLSFFLAWLIFSREAQALFAALMIGGIAMPGASLIAAMVLGRTGAGDSSYEMASFLATRPVSTSDMARALLKTAAGTVVMGWGIWALAFWSVVGFFPTIGVDASSGMQSGLVSFCLFPVATLLATWIVVANGASIGMAGRPALFAKVLAGSFAAYLGTLMIAKQFLSHEGILLLAQVLTFATGIAFVLGTIWAFDAARRKLLIERPFILAAAAVFLVLCATIYALWQSQNHGISASVQVTTLVFLTGLAALVVSPIAAAPLALSWNRVR